MVLTTLVSCAQLSGNDHYGLREEFKFTAVTEPLTRTVLDKNQQVIWNDGDEVSILSDAAPENNEKFTVTNTDVSLAELTGTAVRGHLYHAVYPYRTENKLEGGLLQTRIDPEQTAKAGSFAKGHYLSVAVSGNEELQFRNICALIAFRMPEMGSRTVSKVVLKGNDSEKLTGNVKVAFTDDSAEIKTDKSSVYKATLTGKMTSGQTYYLVTAPQEFSEGVTMTLYTDDGDSFKAVTPTPLTSEAGKILTLPEIKVELDNENDIKKEGEVYHIFTAKGLERFAEIVNKGKTDADAILENNISLKEIKEWSPIGQGTVRYETVSNRTNTAIMNGTPYSGTFDGNNKIISDLHLLANGEISGNATGLFGILDNANVKNLTLGEAGDGSELHVNTSGNVSQETGVLAGLCHESNVTDVTSHVNIRYTGSSTARLTVGLIGSVHSDKKQSILERVVNRGKITAQCVNNSTNGWATAVHVGGICGAAFSAFESGNNSSNRITFLSYCENYGEIESNSGRVGGIAGAAPYYAVLNSCFNHGNITTSNPVSGYAAGMTVYMSTMSGMQDCINNGNVIATNGAGVSGIVGLCSYDNSNFSACANFGDIISDNSKRGVFVSRNSAKSKWMGCTAAGHVGTWNGGDIKFDSYPETLQEKYLGPGANELTLDGIIYQMGSSDVPQGPEPKLRILFIGNSFSQDAVHLLPNLLEGAGLDAVELGLMYWGGSIIQQHNDNFYNNSTNFTYYRKPTSIQGTWLQYKGYTLEDAVKEHAWDIITIQEHTGRTQSWVWDQAEKDAINGLIDKINKAQGENKPEIWYIFSQAYHDLGKSSGTKTNFVSTIDHYKAIAAQAEIVKKEIPGLTGIIPTGTVLQNLRGSSLNNDLGLTRDGYHMDYGLSRYAASCAVYELLVLKSFPQNVLEDNTWRITQSSTGQTPVTDENRMKAITAARKAIEKPFEVSPIE